MQVGVYWKLARPDGWDFYTGKTINYREAVGRVVHAPKFDGELALCGPGILHASRDPLDCFQGAQIPCSAYQVEGHPTMVGKTKFGFTTLKVLREIPEAKLNELFKFNYMGAAHPLDPRTITPPTTIDERIQARLQELVSVWASVGASVGASIRASIRASIKDSAMDSVWASVGASAMDSVWASIRASIRASIKDSVMASVMDSVWASVGDSVWASVMASVGASIRASIKDSAMDSVMDSVMASVMDSVWALEAAYIGTLFPINKWKYTKNVHVKGYPFQAAIDLINVGLIPIRDYEGTSYLLGGKDCKVLWKNKLKVAV